MEAQPAKPGSTHIKRIDVLRGIAILSVISFHFLGATYGYDHPGFQGSFLDFARPSLLWWIFFPMMFGWSGVTLFFVISGYVIHRSHLASGKPSWREFIWRRFWRIMPTYLVFVTLFAYWEDIPFISREFFLHVLLLHNVTDATFFGINPSFWSLAVECQLYALYPLAFYARERWGPTSMLFISVGVAACSAILCLTFVGPPPSGRILWLSPLVLWPTWLIGAVIAERHLVGLYLFASHRSLIILVMGALCVVSQVFQPLSFLSFDFAAVAFAVLLDSYALRAKPLHWSAALLAFVGTASYSVYLIHQPVLPYAVRGMRSLGIYGPGLQIVIGFPLFVPAMAILGWWSYLLLEKNGMRLGRALRLRGRDVDQRTVLSPPV